MSQSQLPAAQADIDEIEEELNFQKVLLNSVQESTPNSNSIKKEILNEIKVLEKKLRDARRGNSQSGADTFGESSQASTPSSSAMEFNNSRKRSSTAVSNGHGDVRDNKLRRTAASSFIAGTPTSSTDDGDDDDDDEFDIDISKLDYKLNTSFMASQRAAEARAERSRKDQALARSMAASSEHSMMSPPPAHNAFSRMGFPHSSQTKPKPDPVSSGYGKTEIKNDASFTSGHCQFRRSDPSTSSSHSKNGSSSNAKHDNAYFKHEYDRLKSSSHQLPIWENSSDAGDSDLEIIEPSAFTPNGRYSQHKPDAAKIMQVAMQNSTPRIGQPLPSPMATVRLPFAYAAPTPHNYSVPGAFPGMEDSSIYGASNNGGYQGLGSYSNENVYTQGYMGDYGFDDHFSVADPKQTTEEIKALLENIKPDVDINPEAREEAPAGLSVPLYEHQKIALTWLKAMEAGSNKGGILADDMGLGKTISTLALILASPSEDRRCKTTLIVGPVALIHQWRRELSLKVKPSHKLSVYMMHSGSNNSTKKVGWDELANYDIVLTTYGTLAHEYKRYERYIESQKAQGNLLDSEIDQRPMKKLFPLLGPKSKFHRILLDEAQNVKNKATVSSKAVCTLHAKTRFCLTGTPMMNNVGELQSLIKFLRIKPYNDAQRFKQTFGTLTKGKASVYQADRAMTQLQALLKAILLRRVKTSLIDGKPIITLPVKTEEFQHVVFSEDEQQFYTALENKTRVQFNKYMKAGTVGRNYSNILVLLLRLRQCCCHPHLIQDFEQAPPPGGHVSHDAMVALAQTLAPDVISRLLEADGFECPVCYDGVPNPTIALPCGHDTCSECLTKISDQQAEAHAAAGDESRAMARCPSCRGDIDMKKLIDYKTFREVHDPEYVNENSVSDDEKDSDSDSDSESDDESDDDANKNGDLRGFVVPDTNVDDSENEPEEEIEDSDAENDDVSISKDKSKKQKEKSEKKKAAKHPGKTNKGKQPSKKTKKPFVSMAMLKKDALKNKSSHRRYMKYMRKHWQPSAKIIKCVELLEHFQAGSHKTIIFSQFVSLLDLLQVPIDDKGWKVERYDGSMSANERNDAITRFTDKADVSIMLISLKAGNAGLNLTAADRVIILDPFWNPYIEMQAVDRAYRIGQRKEVEVHRILIKNTVEDRIMDLQEQKKELVDAALDEKGHQSVSRLGARELAFLFGVEH